jgi:hypothetical protein
MHVCACMHVCRPKLINPNLRRLVAQVKAAGERSRLSKTPPHTWVPPPSFDTPSNTRGNQRERDRAGGGEREKIQKDGSHVPLPLPTALRSKAPRAEDNDMGWAIGEITAIAKGLGDISGHFATDSEIFGAGAGGGMPEHLWARVDRERMLHNFTLYDETSGKAVSTKDIASRLAEVGLRPLSAACTDMRLQLEQKFEQLQAHELEAEGLLILLQGSCADVAQNSANLQRHVLAHIEQLKEQLEARASAMVAHVREQERQKLSSLHDQIGRAEKEYDKMKRSSATLRHMLKDHASMDPVAFMSACQAAEQRITPVLVDAAAFSYRREENPDFDLTLDVSSETLLLQHTNFEQVRERERA